GLKALKLLGVEGVKLIVWWGIVERDAAGKYDWSDYLAIPKMVQKMGLKLHVLLYFHGSTKPHIPLHDWMSRLANTNLIFSLRIG
ncbi:beta-amylase, partial [Stylosanthes scabra]|nr:beta-amylase [Stylosanthes scabra]